MTNEPQATLLFVSLLSNPLSYPDHRDLSQRPLNFPFILVDTATPRTNFLFSFLYFFARPPVKPAGALDGYHHHNPDQGCFEFTSEGCAWTLIFVPDDEPDASSYPEDFAFVTSFDLTQSSEPGERTDGCYPRGWYGCPEPKQQKRQQKREQHEPEQHV